MNNQLNRVNTEQDLPMNTDKQHHHPALSPLATAVKAAIIGFGLAHSSAQAATIEVNSNTDNNVRCTLREAIISVNDGVLKRGCANTGAPFGTNDTINVAASVASDTITLANGELEITQGTEVSINGNGVTVDANQQLSVFDVGSATLMIDDMTITGANNNGFRNVGAISAFDSTVTVNDSTISENSSHGIHVESFTAYYLYYNEYSNLTVTNSTISNNLGQGINTYKSTSPAIDSDIYTHVAVINSQIVGNSGSGVVADNAAVSVTNSTVSDSSMSGIQSFGAFLNVNNSTVSDSSMSGIQSSKSVLNINNSAISGNFDRGIWSYDGRLAIVNSTISNNSVSGSGGGIQSIKSNGEISNSTISNNSAGLSGGGIHIDGDSYWELSNATVSANNGGGIQLVNSYSDNYNYGVAKVTVLNSIIANSRGGGNCSSPIGFNNMRATITSDSASIIEDGSCNTDARAVDPVLLPLADNGCAVMHSTPTGPACVMTHALGAGSPAIDTAVDSDLTVDQIGTPRPQGAAADVGAFELSSIVPTAPGFKVTAVDAVEGEDTQVVFTITLDEPQPGLAGYDFRTEAGTAIDGEDYVGRVGRLLFPAGVTVLKRRIEILEDSVLNEDDETFSLVVTDINNPSATVSTQATIKDAPALPQLSVAVVKARENSGDALVTVLLSEPSTERVLVDFRTVVPSSQFNPATDGVDYVGRRGRITFAPGVTRQTRRITLIDDNLDEANEVFRFELSKPLNAEIASGSERQRVFILNDD